MKTRGWAAAALPAMLLVLSAANAGEPATSGLKVAIDPATGKLRALSEEESAALDGQASSRGIATKRLLVEDAAPAPRAMPAGAGFAMKVPQSEMTHLVATRGADGKVVIQETGAGEDAAQTEALK